MLSQKKIYSMPELGHLEKYKFKVMSQFSKGQFLCRDTDFLNIKIEWYSNS
jgi:hypothetical protein